MKKVTIYKIIDPPVDYTKPLEPFDVEKWHKECAVEVEVPDDFEATAPAIDREMGASE